MNKTEFQKRYGNTIRKPKLSLLLGEARTPLEAAKLAASWRFLPRKDVGQGQTVLLLPGFGASSKSMGLIKRYLDSLGYRAMHWSAGFNHGDVGKLLPRVIADIKMYSDQTQAPVKLVGWSLGGYLAREAAREVQQNVSRVVTIGSPVVGGPKYTALKTLYDVRGTDIDSIENSTLKRFEQPIVCPIVALYSKKDSIVSWQACIDRFSPNVEHIEIEAPHLAMGVSKEVMNLLPYALGTPVK
ncbi:MAG TPA: alpha/beta fold hydrolase [Limnobacter sp.]|nr:alpha/beta fold hydrolase [Limnobacter sp.]